MPNQTDDQQNLVLLCKKIGILLLSAMLLMILVRIIDGDEHRLGTITLNKPTENRNVN